MVLEAFIYVISHCESTNHGGKIKIIHVHSKQENHWASANIQFLLAERLDAGRAAIVLQDPAHSTILTNEMCKKY